MRREEAVTALGTAIELNPSLSAATDALHFCYEETREAAQWSQRIARLKQSSLVAQKPKFALNRWVQSVISRWIGVVRCILTSQACHRSSSKVNSNSIDAKISSMEEVWLTTIEFYLNSD